MSCGQIQSLRPTLCITKRGAKKQRIYPGDFFKCALREKLARVQIEVINVYEASCDKLVSQSQGLRRHFDALLIIMFHRFLQKTNQKNTHTLDF